MNDLFSKLSIEEENEFQSLIDDFDLIAIDEEQIIKCNDADLFGCLKL